MEDVSSLGDSQRRTEKSEVGDEFPILSDTLEALVILMTSSNPSLSSSPSLRESQVLPPVGNVLGRSALEGDTEMSPLRELPDFSDFEYSLFRELRFRIDNLRSRSFQCLSLAS